jgi:hypothetical protein
MIKEIIHAVPPVADRQPDEIYVEVREYRCDADERPFEH